MSAYNALTASSSAERSPLTALAVASGAAAAPSLRFYHLNVSSGPASRRRCATAHTVVRAPRSDGSEGLVLWVQQSARSSTAHADALAAAVGVAAAAHLGRARWLAKDVAVVFADRGCSPLAAAKAWLSVYNSERSLFDFPRAGLMQQALALELPHGVDVRAAELAVHGWQGLLPNADLYYQIKRNLDIHTGLPVRLAAAPSLPAWLRRGAAALAAMLPGFDDAKGDRYVSELATAAGFGLQLAAGEPDGAHGAFLELGVDAATLRLVGGKSHREAHAAGVDAAAAHALTAVELALRTCNNLQERLHHSTALYLLLSPDRMITIAVYLAPPGLLLAAALGQVLLEARRATAAAWRPAWLCLAAIHAAALISALAWHSVVRRPSAGGVDSGPPLAQTAAGTVVAAAALAWWAGDISPAAVAAVEPNSNSSSSGGIGPPLRVAAATVLLMEGVSMLLGHWALCWLLLSAALPLLAATAAAPCGSKAGNLAALAVACLPAAGILRACWSWSTTSLAFYLLTAQLGATLLCCMLSLLM